MTDVRTSIELAAPPERVWKTLTDFDRVGEWVELHAGWPEPPPDRLEEGTRFRQAFELEGQSVEVTWTVERIDAPKALDWAGEGPAGSSASASYRLSESDTGTRLEYATDVDLPGGPLGKVAEKVVEPQSETLAERSLERLRRLVEDGAAG